MLIGHIDHPDTYLSLLHHSVWHESLSWILKNMTKSDGEYSIQDKNIYASIQTIDMLPRDQAVFEAHQNYIDIHYCIQGKELIEWAPINTLTPKTEYDVANDFTLYDSPDSTASVSLTPGTFAIFMPADAHMPKISTAQSSTTKKMVVKIHKSLIK